MVLVLGPLEVEVSFNLFAEALVDLLVVVELANSSKELVEVLAIVEACVEELE